MPAAAIKIISSVVPSIFGALSGRGKQEAQEASFDEQAFQELMRNAATRGLSLPVEDPVSAAFRESLIPLMLQEFKKIQQPLIGEAEKAEGIQNIQKASSDALNNAIQSLAGVGALDSGRAAQLASNIGQEQMSQTTSFLNQIPIQNKLAAREGMLNLFPQAMRLVDLAPRGQISTQEASELGRTESQRKVVQGGSTYGQGFWPTFAGNLAYGLQRDPALRSGFENLLQWAGSKIRNKTWKDIPLATPPTAKPSLWPKLP